MKNKKSMIIITLVLGIATLCMALNLESKGRYRLWKVGTNHVKVQRTITDPNGLTTVVWERSYGAGQANARLAAAQAEYTVWDVNAVDAVKLVAKKRISAGVKVTKWQAIVNKFDSSIDTE